MKRGALRAGDWVRLGRVILGAGTGGLECDLVPGGFGGENIDASVHGIEGLAYGCLADP
jgi:hypothetical protein